jgi:hypothetical protein
MAENSAPKTQKRALAETLTQVTMPEVIDLYSCCDGKPNKNPKNKPLVIFYMTISYNSFSVT